MFRVTKRKPVWEVAATVAERGQQKPLVIQVEPAALAIRVKGRRQWYRMTWSEIYLCAAYAEAASRRTIKPRRRSVRRGALA